MDGLRCEEVISVCVVWNLVFIERDSTWFEQIRGDEFSKFMHQSALQRLVAKGTNNESSYKNII